MNKLTDRQRQTLAAGLSAFAGAARRRRIRRDASRALAAAAVIAIVAMAVDRTLPSRKPQFPAYVRIIEDDRQLQGELQLASACERIERTDGRLQVVECVAMAPRR